MVSTGEHYAVGTRNRLTLGGAWAWCLKGRIAATHALDAVHARGANEALREDGCTLTGVHAGRGAVLTSPSL